MVDILEKIKPNVYGPYVTFDKRGISNYWWSA